MKFKSKFCMMTLLVVFSLLSMGPINGPPGGITINPDIISNKEQEKVIRKSVTDQINVPLFTDELLSLMEHQEEDAIKFDTVVGSLFHETNVDSTHLIDVDSLFGKEYQLQALQTIDNAQEKEMHIIVQFIIILAIVLFLYFMFMLIKKEVQKRNQIQENQDVLMEQE